MFQTAFAIFVITVFASLLLGTNWAKQAETFAKLMTACGFFIGVHEVLQRYQAAHFGSDY